MNIHRSGVHRSATVSCYVSGLGGGGGLACLIVVVVAGIVQLRLLTGSCAAQITADIHSKSVYLKFVRSKHSVWILI